MMNVAANAASIEAAAPLPAVTMREALEDDQLLGRALPGDSWRVWRTVLIAAMGEPLTNDESEIFKAVTGGREPPRERVSELWAIVGRRGGKDRAASVLAAYLAALFDHSAVLAPGEIGTVVCLAPDQRQAAITRNYIQGVFETSPMLADMVASATADQLILQNGIVVDVRAASFRRIRGITACAVIASEASFWFSDDAESRNPDSAILQAVRPALATTNGPLVVISSPYARRGEVWDTFRKHYGVDGDPSVLVVHGAARVFNPTLNEKVVERAMERDPEAARAEYMAEFRSDIAAFVDRAAVDACVDAGCRERPPRRDFRYYAFVDPSGGSSDSMTLAIGHRENDVAIVDAIREVAPPFDPDSVVREFVAVLEKYSVREVTGDRYAGNWVAQSFEKAGVKYVPSDLPKSALYLELLPLVNSRRIRFLDHQRAINQLCSLERRTTRGGRDSIDHPPNAHDDVANAIAGVANLLATPQWQGGWRALIGHY